MFKQMKKILKNQKGLTLIELLAVIVILGIIAAIAVPSIGGIINKTENDAKVAEGLQIISAAKLYATAKAPADNTTITQDELIDYLDNVKDIAFTVNFTKSENGKYIYKLIDHDAADVISNEATAGTLTEAELLAY